MRRVLVVDDHPDAAEVVCAFLRVLGHATCAATTGEAALREAEAFAPDLVIIDIGLPDLSGYEVARRLRVRLGPGVYLVAMTGWGQPADRASALAAGFDRHVVKPPDAAKLTELIAAADQARDATTPG